MPAEHVVDVGGFFVTRFAAAERRNLLVRDDRIDHAVVVDHPYIGVDPAGTDVSDAHPVASLRVIAKPEHERAVSFFDVAPIPDFERERAILQTA